MGEAIVVEESDLTLEGGGFTVTGDGTGDGVTIDEQTYVTVTNLNVTGFDTGIFLMNYDSGPEFLGQHHLIGNTVSNNDINGISLTFSSSNTIDNNIVSSNGSEGITLAGVCEDNIITNNTADFNGGSGIEFLSDRCDYNEVSNNSASYNTDGIVLGRSIHCDLTDNMAMSNTNYGIWLVFESGVNDLIHNVIAYNATGLAIGQYCNNNHIYNNSFIDNGTQAAATPGTLNYYDSEAPDPGGNYWSDLTGPDDEEPFGIVDIPWTCLLYTSPSPRDRS